VTQVFEGVTRERALAALDKEVGVAEQLEDDVEVVDMLWNG
jgi:hypothetical protein